MERYAALFGQDDESTPTLPIVPLQLAEPKDNGGSETDRIRDGMVEDTQQVLDGFMNGN